MNKSLELQNNLRQTVFQTHESRKSQKSWEMEMKNKEQEFIKQKQELAEVVSVGVHLLEDLRIMTTVISSP